MSLVHRPDHDLGRTVSWSGTVVLGPNRNRPLNRPKENSGSDVKRFEKKKKVQNQPGTVEAQNRLKPLKI